MLDSIRSLMVQFGRMFVWWIIISPWEQIVRVRLGKHVKVFGGGVHLKIPYIDEIYRQSVRRRMVSTGIQTLTSADGKTVTVVGRMGYCIDSMLRLYNSLHHPEDTLKSMMQGLISEYIVANVIADDTPIKLSQYVQENADLGQYGLGEVEFFVTNFAVVKTYRLINDDANNWMDGDSLQTDVKERTPGY